MKGAHLRLAREIGGPLLIPFAHLDQISGHAASLRIALVQIFLEISPVAPNGIAELRQALE